MTDKHLENMTNKHLRNVTREELSDYMRTRLDLVREGERKITEIIDSSMPDQDKLDRIIEQLQESKLIIQGSQLHRRSSSQTERLAIFKAESKLLKEYKNLIVDFKNEREQVYGNDDVIAPKSH